MAISIPNIFVPDTLILSEEVNENFAELGQRALNSAGDTITGNIAVDGGITIDGVDISEALGLAGILNITELNTSGDVNVGGELNVPGVANIGTANITTLNVSGLSTLTDLIVNGTSRLKGAVTTDGTLSVGTNLTVLGTSLLTGAVTASTSIRAPGYYEENRTFPMGHWVSEPFLAANYTASTGTWVLTAPDQILLGYTVVGKTMSVSFIFNDTTVTGNPSTLHVKIPGGFVAHAAANGRGVIDYLDNGTGGLIGNCAVLGSETVIRMVKSGAAPWANATNTTDIRGSITFQVA